jgi:2-polyprenyl-3-methyl-5-hydroxy-6-metoxy-1,4-benzoquinol methylase
MQTFAALDVASASAAAGPRCLYCHSSRLSPYWSGIRDRLGHLTGENRFDRCDECDSLRLSIIPAEAELAHIHSAAHDSGGQLGQAVGIRRWLAQLEHRLFFAPQYRAQVQQVLQTTELAGREGLRLLDVGCDCGPRLAAFRNAGLEVAGLDVQPEVIANLKREYGISGEVGGIEALAERFASGSFDIITTFYLLEHLPDVSAVLASSRRLLKPGGWFVGVVPVCDGLQARLFGERWLHVTQAPRHLSLPSSLGLLQAASRAGYVSLQIRPDSLLNCAGIVGESLLPGSDLTNTGSRGQWAAIVRRILGGICAIAAIPLCVVENYLLGETSHAMLFAQTPADRGSRS